MHYYYGIIDYANSLRLENIDDDHLLFYVPFGNLSFVWKHLFYGERVQNLSLCSVLRAFGHGRTFITQHILWHGNSIFFSVSSERTSLLIASYDTQEDDEGVQINTYQIDKYRSENWELISSKGAWRVWPVSRGCLLLLGTWSYFCICRRSVLPYTRFCNCLLDYDYVIHIVNFAILYRNIGRAIVEWST
jgi:hypothetical protein